MLSECVEVYTEVPQQACFNEVYSQAECEYDNSTGYASSTPIAQQQQFITELPHQIDNQALQTYDDLVESPLVDELCQLEWYEEPVFAQEIQEEMAQIAKTAENSDQIDDMSIYENTDDLFSLFNWVFCI